MRQRPLLLIYGLGGRWQSWNLESVLNDLAAQRDVIAVDLPGFGRTLRLPVETSIPTLPAKGNGFYHTNSLAGIDAAGSSMGDGWCLSWRGGVVSLDAEGFGKGRNAMLCGFASGNSSSARLACFGKPDVYLNAQRLLPV